MKTLKELGVNIIGGQILARVNADPNKGDKVLDYKRKTVLAKSVDEGVLVEENIPCNDYKTLPDEKRLTKKGDIIIKMNAPFYSCLIEENQEGMLVSSFCSIIRDVNDFILDKKYLVTYLNSPIGQKQLSLLAQGQAISLISIARLYELEIKIPSLEQQKIIGNEYFTNKENLRLLQRIAELEREKLFIKLEELRDE